MKQIIIILILLQFHISIFSQNWDNLNQGVDDAVRSLYYDTLTSKLYVGGTFVYSSGIKTRGVATWDGISWDSLGSGMDGHDSISIPGNTLSITRYGNELYFGGAFTTVDDLPISNLARWNGNQWDSVNFHFNSAVGKLKVINGELYACGVFDSVGGGRANGLAKFNGTVWSDVFSLPRFYNDTNFNHVNNIDEVVSFLGNLYISGIFYGDSSRTHLAQWNGSSWKDVGGGLLGSSFYWVNCMTVYQNELYVAGLFFKSEGNAGNSIMRWDGFSWSDVGNGVGGIAYPQIRAMSVINDNLYVIGNFITAGNLYSPGIARWDGNDWCSIESNFNGGANAIEFYHDSVIVGGYFDPINTNAVNNIAKKSVSSIEDTCLFHIGVNEFELNEILIFPTIFSNKLTIISSQFQIKKVEIFNSLGRLVFSLELNSFNAEFLIPELKSGVYFAAVSTENSKIVRKILKY
ncbi:MAG: T9SS type A sorting domain-containing protein [Bacteroidota bacterium]